MFILPEIYWMHVLVYANSDTSYGGMRQRRKKRQVLFFSNSKPHKISSHHEHHQPTPSHQQYKSNPQSSPYHLPPRQFGPHLKYSYPPSQSQPPPTQSVHYFPQSGIPQQSITLNLRFQILHIHHQQRLQHIVNLNLICWACFSDLFCHFFFGAF